MAATVERRSTSCGALVLPDAHDAREAQREPRGMPRRAVDDVEGDLDDDRGLDDAVAPVDAERVRLEPARHLRDLGVGQAAVGLADGDELALGRIGSVVDDRERVVREDPVAPAVPDLDADDDAVERRERLLELEPGEAAATRGIDRVGVLDR